MKFKIVVFFITILSCNSILHSQNSRVDSLLTIIKSDKSDTSKVDHLLDISYILQYSNPDSSIIFSNQAYEFLIKTKNLPKFWRQTKEGICLHKLALAYYLKANYLKSLDFYFKALAIWDKLEVESKSKTRPQILTSKSKTLGNIGIIYDELGDYKKALDYYFKALKIDESLGRKSGIATKLGNIGIIYKEQAMSIPDTSIKNPKRDSLYQKSLNCYFKALKIDEELDDKTNIVIWLGNIGVVYDELGDYGKALDHYFQALKMAEQLDDKNRIAINLENIGSLYISQKKFKNAFDYLYRAISISKSIGAINDVKIQYDELSALYEKSNILLPDTIGGKLLGFEQMRLRSLYYYKQHIALRDTLFNQENKNQLVQKEMNYEFEKKEAVSKAENKKQRIIIWFIISGLVLVLGFTGFILRSLQITHKQKDIIEEQKGIVDEKNKILNQQNEEIISQRDEIEAQRDEIEAQRDMVVKQKDHIEAQKKEITDSIVYAKQIQQALLPASKYAESILGEHFILFKPKDIVSGDFFWFTKIGEWLIITVADCTGHGVPGAFMSMLGISFLNEIVRKKEITNASEILDHLRESIIEALQQKGYSGEQRDGMDMALVVLNVSNNQLQYSGANNPLYIVTASKELKEIEPDKQPVAINFKMKSFANHIIQMEKGDCIYLASDGYMDQFGGSNYKKFRISQLKELFLNFADRSMTEQKKILDTTFENWKGANEQIDDVTILGFRV